jgi:hypothetical protein
MLQPYMPDSISQSILYFTPFTLSNLVSQPYAKLPGLSSLSFQG